MGSGKERGAEPRRENAAPSSQRREGDREARRDGGRDSHQDSGREAGRGDRGPKPQAQQNTQRREDRPPGERNPQQQKAPGPNGRPAQAAPQKPRDADNEPAENENELVIVLGEPDSGPTPAGERGEGGRSSRSRRGRRGRGRGEGREREDGSREEGGREDGASAESTSGRAVSRDSLPPDLAAALGRAAASAAAPVAVAGLIASEASSAPDAATDVGSNGIDPSMASEIVASTPTAVTEFVDTVEIPAVSSVQVVVDARASVEPPTPIVATRFQQVETRFPPPPVEELAPAPEIPAYVPGMQIDDSEVDPIGDEPADFDLAATDDALVGATDDDFDEPFLDEAPRARQGAVVVVPKNDLSAPPASPQDAETSATVAEAEVLEAPQVDGSIPDEPATSTESAVDTAVEQDASAEPLPEKPPA